MYFADLTDYCYTKVRLAGDASVLLNVGWLDADQDYQRGTVSLRLVTHLLRMAMSYTVAMRGTHKCPFCASRVTMTFDGQAVYLGNAELRARAGDITYVAPSLLPHYIAAHNYRPPDRAHWMRSRTQTRGPGSAEPITSWKLSGRDHSQRWAFSSFSKPGLIGSTQNSRPAGSRITHHVCTFCMRSAPSRSSRPTSASRSSVWISR